MAGLQDPYVIDLVGQEADGTCLLVIVEERPWGSDPDQPRQLREKINSYTGYIVDGSLVKQYPEISGQPVKIQLNCSEAPPGELADVVRHAASQLERIGVGFAVRVVPHSRSSSARPN
jgi:hypothetical protein